MSAQNPKKPKLAERIADKLFVNEIGEKATHLMLLSVRGNLLGGWCKQDVIRCIVEALNE